MTRLRVIDEAEQDLLEAMEWYEARRTGLGDALSDAYEDALRSIARSPIVFELIGDEIVVVSVAHAKRRFAFWRHRRT